MAGLESLVRTDFKAVDKRDPLNSVMGWLTRDTGKRPVVVDDGKPFGIVNERALMSRRLDSNAHVHQFTLATRALDANTSIEDARARMAEYRASYLPFADAKGKLVGYVSAIDLAREGLDGENARDLSVAVTFLRETQTLGEALNAFNKEYVDFLPVLRDDGRIAGVLPRASLLQMAFNAGDRGRKDAGGEKSTLLHDPVSGFMDEAPRMSAPNAAAEGLLDTVAEAGYAIVGSLERPEGIVTAETLFARG